MAYDCYCDYDPPEFFIQETRKARKQHQCFECSGTIVAGNQYEYVRGKWDGEVGSFKTCQRCLELRQWATISVPCFCWHYGGLHEDVREMVREVAPGVPGFFMEYGRRMVAIRQAAKKM